MTIYSEIKDPVQKLIGNRTDTDSDSIVLTAFNNVQLLLARAHPWKELQAKSTPSFVVSQSSYTQAELSLTRFRKIYSFRVTEDTTSHPIKYYTPQAWDREISARVPAGNTGRPDVYTYWAKSFEFQRVPDSTYEMTIRYYQYPTLITDDADTIIFENIDDILISLTTAYAWLGLEEVRLYGVEKSKAKSLMALYGIEDLSMFGFEPSEVTTGSTAVPGGSQTRGESWTDPFSQK